MATAFKQVKNNAFSTVAVGSGIIGSAVGTSIVLATGDGTKFPSPGNGFWVTVWDSITFASPNNDPNMEIMLCTARSTDTLTVTRAQLGTSAISTFASGRAVRLLIQDQNITDAYTGVNNIENNGPSIFRNPYKFSAYRHAAMNLTASAWQKIPFDTEEFDTGNNHDTVTNIGRFTAPIAGFYQFNAAAGSAEASGSNFFIIALYKNGVEFKRGTQNFGNGVQINFAVTSLIQLAATDYVEVWVYNGSAATPTLFVDTNTYFNGFLVSAT